MLERVLRRCALTTSVVAVTPSSVTPVPTVSKGGRERGAKQSSASVKKGGRGAAALALAKKKEEEEALLNATSRSSGCHFDATAVLVSEKEIDGVRKLPSALGSRKVEVSPARIGLSASSVIGFHGVLGEHMWTSVSKSTSLAVPSLPFTPLLSQIGVKGGRGGAAVSLRSSAAAAGGGGGDAASLSGEVSSDGQTATTSTTTPVLLVGLSRTKTERAHFRRSTGAGVGPPSPSSLAFTTPTLRQKPVLLQPQSLTISEYREAVTRAVRAGKRLGPQVETLRLCLPSPSVLVTSTVNIFQPTPYIFSTAELAEKTACFAVTGAYRYTRCRKGNDEGRGRRGSGGEEAEEDLWEQEEDADEGGVSAAEGEALDRIGKRGIRASRFSDAVYSTTTTRNGKDGGPLGSRTRGGGGAAATTTTRGKGGKRHASGRNGKRKVAARHARGGGHQALSTKGGTRRGGKGKEGVAVGNGLQRVLIDTTLQAEVETGSIIGGAVNAARDIGNLREDEGTPEFYVQWMLKQMETQRLKGITVKKILRGVAIEEAGMHLLYNVGRGSIYEPCVMVLEYVGNRKSAESTALVGKGVTFDCGGLNVKPYGSMETMHTDMMGAAAVLTTLQAVAKLELPINLVAVVGLVENAIGPQSYHPGCILQSHKGLSVEVRNTDAEGRLVLADLFSYLYGQEETGRCHARLASSAGGRGGTRGGLARNTRGGGGGAPITPRHLSFHLTKRPTSLIDLATLTGAITISLGHHRAGCFSNDGCFSDALMEAGSWCGEELWPMPIGVEHVRAVQGGMADLVNTPAGRGGGSCTAAAFLSHFVPSGVKWAHLDIAGPADAGDKGKGIIHPPGATGFGVQLLMDYLRRGNVPQAPL